MIRSYLYTPVWFMFLLQIFKKKLINKQSKQWSKDEIDLDPPPPQIPKYTVLKYVTWSIHVHAYMHNLCWQWIWKRYRQLSGVSWFEYLDKLLESIKSAQMFRIKETIFKCRDTSIDTSSSCVADKKFMSTQTNKIFYLSIICNILCQINDIHKLLKYGINISVFK